MYLKANQITEPQDLLSTKFLNLPSIELLLAND